MKKCNHCHTKIVDATVVCPLCRNSVANLDEANDELMYPAIEFDVQKYHLITRIFLFVSIIVAVLLVLINFLTETKELWSLIPVGAIVYALITLKYSILNNANFAAKILVQTLGALLFVLLIDWVTGYKGWSVNYAIPAIIIVANAAILILMIVNFMNWQSYLVFQIALALFSLIPVVLYFREVIISPVLTFIAAGSAFVIWIGTMIFGDKKAKNELIRRFHI